MGPSVLNLSPTWKRMTFAENIVVDIKLVEIAPGQSAIKNYLNGVEYNGKAHPLTLDPSMSTNQLLEGIREWADRIIANPTGE